jgi:hypothetical protein
MNCIRALWVSALFFAFTSAQAVSVWDFFHPIGPSEQMVGAFDHSVEATTANAYSGYVAIDISGIGWDNNNEVYDAFWFFGNGNFVNWTPVKSGKSHRITFGGNNALSPESRYIGDDTDINYVNSLYSIVFNEDVGLREGVNYYGIPEYRVDHRYVYVLRINSLPRVINLGFGDGGIGDNSGEYRIVLTPVAVGVVPEPATTALFALGLVILGFCRRIF